MHDNEISYKINKIYQEKKLMGAIPLNKKKKDKEDKQNIHELILN
jgi:hypothetical protein